MAQVLNFPTRHGHSPSTHALPSERVAALMISMEQRPLTEPVIRIAVGLDRIWRVQVTVGDHSAVLTPAEARLCADALLADNAMPGVGLVAVRLDEAAEQAEMAMPSTPHRGAWLARAADRGPPEHGSTGSSVLIGLALVAALAVILGYLPTGGGL